jgi:hypothetical protein
VDCGRGWRPIRHSLSAERAEMTSRDLVTTRHTHGDADETNSMFCPNKMTQLQIMNIGVTPMEAIQVRA